MFVENSALSRGKPLLAKTDSLKGSNTMTKLIKSYQENPNDKTATRIYKHIKKHPFCVVMLSKAENIVVNQALESI